MLVDFNLDGRGAKVIVTVYHHEDKSPEDTVQIIKDFHYTKEQIWICPNKPNQVSTSAAKMNPIDVDMLRQELTVPPYLKTQGKHPDKIPENWINLIDYDKKDEEERLEHCTRILYHAWSYLRGTDIDETHPMSYWHNDYDVEVQMIRFFDGKGINLLTRKFTKDEPKIYVVISRYVEERSLPPPDTVKEKHEKRSSKREHHETKSPSSQGSKRSRGLSPRQTQYSRFSQPAMENKPHQESSSYKRSPPIQALNHLTPKQKPISWFYQPAIENYPYPKSSHSHSAEKSSHHSGPSIGGPPHR
jgi:hypothetical protein